MLKFVKSLVFPGLDGWRKKVNRERTEREKICIGGGGGKERRKCKQGLGGREKGVDSFSSHSPSSSYPIPPPKTERTDRISRPLVIFLMVDDEACKCVPTKQGTKSNNSPQREEIGGFFAFSRNFFYRQQL